MKFLRTKCCWYFNALRLGRASPAPRALRCNLRWRKGRAVGQPPLLTAASPAGGQTPSSSPPAAPLELRRALPGAASPRSGREAAAAAAAPEPGAAGYTGLGLPGESSRRGPVPPRGGRCWRVSPRLWTRGAGFGCRTATGREGGAGEGGRPCPDSGHRARSREWAAAPLRRDRVSRGAGRCYARAVT